ncbi:hypothetical protein TPHV1_100080 [Treponema phagedenis]|uniref:Uncharacterized protein n=1 Tax=Treponema phagedenis TaxID=162 RepID=A0A0B7GUW4_TREPH|nr:hypothetical protein TPHV1_100080 [Treponema phagedenis]
MSLKFIVDMSICPVVGSEGWRLKKTTGLSLFRTAVPFSPQLVINNAVIVKTPAKMRKPFFFIKNLLLEISS